MEVVGAAYSNALMNELSIEPPSTIRLRIV
jgi:hypothetical protein